MWRVWGEVQDEGCSTEAPEDTGTHQGEEGAAESGSGIIVHGTVHRNAQQFTAGSIYTAGIAGTSNANRQQPARTHPQ